MSSQSTNAELDRELDIFNDTFGKYKSVTDRHQSLYIFVINGVTIENLIERVTKMVTMADTITNPVRKSYIKTRLNKFLENLTVVEPLTNVEGIYFVGSSTNFIELNRYWKDTLNMFQCSDMLVRYDDVYQLEWLNNLLLDRNYVHVLHFRNNNVRHYYLGLTKRKLHQDKTEKKMDVMEFIQENVGGNICMIHGVSSFLKGLTDTDNMKIFNGDKRDEELIEEYEKILNRKNCKILKIWMDKLTHPTEGRRLVFGQEIGKGIQDCLLKAVFCSPERKIKLMDNFSLDNKMPELIVIKQLDDDEYVRRFMVDFKGGLGITYF